MNMLQEFLKFLGRRRWFAKAAIWQYIHGPYGVAKCIEMAPFEYVIPLLRKYGAKVGEKCTIETGIQLHRPARNNPFGNLTIADHVYLGHNALIDLTEPVDIGPETAVGGNCQIWTHTGDWTLDRSDEKEKRNSVSIGKAVIIYSGAIISQGVNIGDYARVGAASVILHDVPEMEFWAGSPAALVKKRVFNQQTRG
jgi:acetyltransferase-like isoleucine patch superfamily enzyme